MYYDFCTTDILCMPTCIILLLFLHVQLHIHIVYAIPFGLNSKYAHPDEILFLGFATITGPAITGPHLITLWLWIADFHDYHHRQLYTKSGNYSSTFVYMEWKMLKEFSLQNLPQFNM
ncbi:hypothetical protein DCAR_0207638 [Daucus carota subsp. sativus]|uniref:Fatty acid hydroxylase domain-containing protein n=1 Tax=Daucus carota subsp. sativus TaxID=79200 RepID=A0AAF0WHP0_DAUCS|nr:hypothetical protein DCAR_0207638 [Daucus carota subsp. sativus]